MKPIITPAEFMQLLRDARVSSDVVRLLNVEWTMIVGTRDEIDECLNAAHAHLLHLNSDMDGALGPIGFGVEAAA